MRVLCVVVASCLANPFVVASQEDAVVRSSGTRSTYTLVDGWMRLPAGRKTLGDSHGEIAVDRAGRVYVSTETREGAIQVFSPDGKFERAIATDFAGIHGFVIHAERDREFIYAAHLAGRQVVKLTLDGELVLRIPESAFPRRFLRPGENGGLRVTGVDVAPNGDIFAVDGYALDFIHRFDRNGKYRGTFGGQAEPWKLRNCHKIAVDPRYDPPRLVACDRGNNRLLHLDLNGKLIATIATGLRRPSGVDFHGDKMVVAEIAGRVSVFDGEHRMIATIGTNDNAKQTNTNRVRPEDWTKGVVTSPHGIAFDRDGNILVTEWNRWGRVLKFSPRR